MRVMISGQSKRISLCVALISQEISESEASRRGLVSSAEFVESAAMAATQEQASGARRREQCQDGRLAGGLIRDSRARRATPTG